MKKLNRKGFTLIELLAVIVILAIIVVVTVPTILSIDDARLSTINSLSKEVATWYDESVVKDEMAFGDGYIQILKGAKATANWQCLTAVKGSGDSIDKLYGLTSNDIKIEGTAYNGTKVTDGTCSSIRLNAAGHAEVLLVGNPTGKFGSKYSFSTDANGKKLG